MAKDFKGLLRSLSKQITQNEVQVVVACMKLPNELKEQSAEVVLAHLVPDGKLSTRSLEVVMDAIKELGRNDLYKEVKAFKKKSRKMLPEEVPDSSENFQNFDVAEREAMQLKNTLQKMEGSDAIDGIKRIEEVYIEARETAERLVRLIRTANCLSRTFRPASASRQTSEQYGGSPPLTSSTEMPDVPDTSPPATSGLMGLLNRRKVKSTKASKTKDKQGEAAPSQNSQRKLNRCKCCCSMR